jgi:hypothetical protein
MTRIATQHQGLSQIQERVKTETKLHHPHLRCLSYINTYNSVHWLRQLGMQGNLELFPIGKLYSEVVLDCKLLTSRIWCRFPITELFPDIHWRD